MKKITAIIAGCCFLMASPVLAQVKMKEGKQHYKQTDNNPQLDFEPGTKDKQGEWKRSNDKIIIYRETDNDNGDRREKWGGKRK